MKVNRGFSLDFPDRSQRGVRSFAPKGPQILGNCGAGPEPERLFAPSEPSIDIQRHILWIKSGVVSRRFWPARRGHGMGVERGRLIRLDSMTWIAFALSRHGHCPPLKPSGPDRRDGEIRQLLKTPSTRLETISPSSHHAPLGPDRQAVLRRVAEGCRSPSVCPADRWALPGRVA